MKANQLSQAQTIDTQTELLALTNFDNNIVNLLTIETLLNNIVKNSNDNALGYNDGLLYLSDSYPQPVNTLSGTGTVTLNTNTINRVTITGDLTFNLPTPTANIFNQIVVQVSMQTLYNVNLGTSYTFNNVFPSLTETGNYNLIYEHDGSNWYVGIIARGEIS